MAGAHQQELAAFTAKMGFRGKGPLSVALVVTQHARKMGLPLHAERLFSFSDCVFSSLSARTRQRQERAKPVHSSLSTPLP
jgi:hypothetical protein